MELPKKLILGMGLAALFSAGNTAWALPTVDMGTNGICPKTVGHSRAGGAGIGNATACNLVITFNANGSIVTTAGPQTTYENIEDALIGVVNNSGRTITSFNLDGGSKSIFGFDGDGINIYTFVNGIEADISPFGTNTDTTGYGGFNAFFTNIVGSTGTVNFANSGIASGGTDFFSLEHSASLNLKVKPTTVPEPSILALLGLGLAGLGFLKHRRKA